MVFRIKLSHIIVEIHSLHDTTAEFCADYITQEGPPHITAVVTPEDIEAERKISLQEMAFHEETIHYNDQQLELHVVQRKICNACVQHSMFMMHGSAVAVDNCGYLFTALSGTGKTTHTNLWRKNIPGSYIVNGDKPFLHVADTVTVCGSPWCGKEFLQTNTAVPLKAIVLLERGTENEIAEISFQEAFPTLLSQSYHNADREQLLTTLALMQKMAATVRFYRLKCNMEDEAALVSYHALHSKANI